MIVTNRRTIVGYKRHLLASRGNFEISKKAFKDRLLDARLAMSVRERRTVGQAELARLVGVTPQAWSLWEQGTEPDYARLPRIAEVLGTTVAQLMGEKSLSIPLEEGVERPVERPNRRKKKHG